MNKTETSLKTNLHEALVKRLREMIIEGELVAGEKIKENDLCNRFDVSRTPLREALKVLASEGYVRIELYRGSWVSKITAEEIEEYFPIIASLEALAGELACKQASDDDVVAFELLHKQLVDAYTDRDLVGYGKINRKIHEEIFRMAGNATLSQIYANMTARIYASRFILRRSEELWRAAIEDHGEFVLALGARDGAKLSQLLRRHVLVHAAAVARASLQAER